METIHATEGVARHGGTRWHASVQEFGDYCEQNGAEGARKRAGRSENSDWVGGTYSETMRLLRLGDTSAVPEAERLLAQINTQINVRGLLPTWDTSPVGAFPHVPAFLAGAPESMWTKSLTPSPKGPVKIVFCMTNSGSFGVDSLRKRGTATLALAMALSIVRPVEVWAVSALDVQHQPCIRISSPIDLSEASYVLANPAFNRSLVYGLAFAEGMSGAWSSWARNDATARKVFRLSEDDIYMGPAIDGEGSCEAQINRPVEWINGILDKHRE